MLGKLSQHFTCINVRVLEPLEKQLVQYKASVKSKSHEQRGVHFDWRQQTLEQYQQAGDPTSFHLISAVHVMYYLKNPESSLMYLYNHLTPGGMMVLVINAGKFDICKHCRRHWYCVGKWIASSLSKLGICRRVFFVLHVYLRVT